MHGGSTEHDNAVGARSHGDPAMLEMKETCERCEAPLSDAGAAVICSFECTFCETCGTEMKHRCPNCGGELVSRPRRTAI